MVIHQLGRRAHPRIARDEQNVIPFVKVALKRAGERKVSEVKKLKKLKKNML